MLSYFSTSFNQNVQPGGLLWVPGRQLPIRSPQVFEESLEEQNITDTRVSIQGTNLTTSVYAATTVDNPAYGVKAGQQVEILLLQINSNISTFVIGKLMTEYSTPLLVSLVETIASSEELEDRIKLFVEGDDGDDEMVVGDDGDGDDEPEDDDKSAASSSFTMLTSMLLLASSTFLIHGQH
jgi:hypothetical protein